MYEYPICMTCTPWLNPLWDSASTEAFSSFTNQSMILRVDMDNTQPQMDQSDMQPHDHVQEQEGDFSPPQNEQNSPKHKNSQIPQAHGNVTVTIANIHSPLHHIDVQHRASSSIYDQGSIQEDDTVMEQNVTDNTIVKKPYACDSGAAEAVATGAGTATAGVGAEVSSPPSAGERSKTDVEQGKSQAKSSSPLKERLTTFFTHGLLAKARQVTNRLYRSPNKNFKNWRGWWITQWSIPWKK